MAEGQQGGELTVEASVNANIIPKISTKVKFEGNEISTHTCLSDKCDINKFVVLFQDSYIFFDETGQQKLTKCKIMILGSIINSTLVLTPSFVNFNIRPKSEEDKPFDGQLKFGIKCKNPEIKKLLPEKEFHSYWSSQRSQSFTFLKAYLEQSINGMFLYNLPDALMKHFLEGSVSSVKDLASYLT